jgi:hypothetical protein
VENAREGRDLKRLDTTETVGRDLATSVQSQSCTDQFEADEMRIDYLVAGEEGPTLAGRPQVSTFVYSLRIISPPLSQTTSSALLPVIQEKRWMGFSPRHWLFRGWRKSLRA